MLNLLAGYRRFRENQWPAKRELFESLARSGQHPNALVLTCVDSRVDPAMIFDATPGEMLVARNVAALVPPYRSNACEDIAAALEFAVKAMQVRNIMVMGHGLCGGAQALLDGSPENESIARWMSLAWPALGRVSRCASAEERRRCCEHEIVKLSVANLAAIPWISSRVESGTLGLHGAWFDIGKGELLILGPGGSFAPPV
ncbi:MAG: carbonic anhydrase [Bryobacteraceae bacterium]